MIRDAAIFIATVEGSAIGVVAALHRGSALERGLGSMWVAPPWRGRGVAAMLVATVVAWSRSEGAARIGLWVPEDSPRAGRFYERQGFRATGPLPFPGDHTRLISEMSLSLHGKAARPGGPAGYR